MVHYLVGNDTVYPNLRLSLWSEIEDFNKTTFGTLRLHGDLELRVNDWFDFDKDGNPLDNRLIEMGWFFAEQQKQPGPDELEPEKFIANLPAKVYDGVKVKLLYNHDYVNDPTNS